MTFGRKSLTIQNKLHNTRTHSCCEETILAYIKTRQIKQITVNIVYIAEKTYLEVSGNSQIFLITTVDRCKTMRTFWKITFVYINVTQEELADRFKTRISTMRRTVHHSKSRYLKYYKKIIIKSKNRRLCVEELKLKIVIKKKKLCTIFKG